MKEPLRLLTKRLISDGRLTRENVAELRNALFDEEGMNRPKGDHLFELKDKLSRDHAAPEFEQLFVEAITSLLLEDDISPGEIDDDEARWLRARIQYKGYFDSLDEKLLSNLRRKSINFPRILNYKSRSARFFESTLYYSRYLTIFAVMGSLISAVALFAAGTKVVFKGLWAFFQYVVHANGTYDELIKTFVSSVDIYLFAMVLVIFGMGVYELFINKIDPVEMERDTRPSWLQISSIDDLKSSLGKVILMVLIVLFFKESLNIDYNGAKDLLLLAVGIALVALALLMANSGHGHSFPSKKQKPDDEAL